MFFNILPIALDTKNYTVPPTTDGRELILPRYTYPEKDIALLLYKLKLKLPNQPPPKIQYQPNKCGADLLPKIQ
ncbi:hypothetical protein OMAG_001643 [Candidatus Omnitrophus magneticus]|uniref:Uncharacterized protein n=1 Tax=Candidatus Omnitrophus magneticus TaxID=1609969 RepID=A0A0F0CSI1_9BACT|nr:hypothetical protein OMAG_001643 [Candidatus Omnitrophus magneticus]